MGTTLEGRGGGIVLPGAGAGRGALPGQGCPVLPGQEARMIGCGGIWQAFLLTQLGEAFV